MNYNDVRSLAQTEYLKRAQKPEVVTADVIQKAEMATQVMGHPGWQFLVAEIDQVLAASQAKYDDLLKRIAHGRWLPHEFQWRLQDAAELNSYMTGLRVARGIIPEAVKKGAPDAAV